MIKEQRAKIVELACAAHNARERFGMLATMNRNIAAEARKDQAIAYAIARAEIFRADKLLMAELED